MFEPGARAGSCGRAPWQVLHAYWGFYAFNLETFHESLSVPSAAVAMMCCPGVCPAFAWLCHAGDRGACAAGVPEGRAREGVPRMKGLRIWYHTANQRCAPTHLFTTSLAAPCLHMCSQHGPVTACATPTSGIWPSLKKSRVASLTQVCCGGRDGYGSPFRLWRLLIFSLPPMCGGSLVLIGRSALRPCHLLQPWWRTRTPSCPSLQHARPSTHRCAVFNPAGSIVCMLPHARPVHKILHPHVCTWVSFLTVRCSTSCASSCALLRWSLAPS
jgi:hypothetical protein